MYGKCILNFVKRGISSPKWMLQKGKLKLHNPRCWFITILYFGSCTNLQKDTFHIWFMLVWVHIIWWPYLSIQDDGFLLSISFLLTNFYDNEFGKCQNLLITFLDFRVLLCICVLISWWILDSITHYVCRKLLANAGPLIRKCCYRGDQLEIRSFETIILNSSWGVLKGTDLHI